MTGPAQADCVYCGRRMWLAGLEPCCDKPDHAGRLVCADVRSCVGVVLARLHDQVPDRNLVTGGDLPTVLAALSEAAEWRRRRADVPCDDCGVSAAGVCDRHGWDLDAADAYDAVRQKLGDDR
jgi:hypothetical protein